MSLGGGGSRTTTQASYPDEFKPLASSAVNQIQQTQGLLPLAGFARYAPGGTAGIGAAGQFAIDELLPATLQANAGTRGLMSLASPVSEIATGLIGSSGGMGAEDIAMARLLGGQASFPSGGRLGTGAPDLSRLRGLMPQSESLWSAFPGLTPEKIEASRGAVSRGDVPVIGGVGVPRTLTAGRPMDASQFTNPFELVPPDLTASGPLRGLLPPDAQGAFDAALAQGATPQAAYSAALNSYVIQQSAGAARAASQQSAPVYVDQNTGGSL